MRAAARRGEGTRDGSDGQVARLRSPGTKDGQDGRWRQYLTSLAGLYPRFHWAQLDLIAGCRALNDFQGRPGPPEPPQPHRTRPALSGDVRTGTRRHDQRHRADLAGRSHVMHPSTLT